MSSAPITIKAFETGEESRWDAYVEGAAGASFFHLSGWRRVLCEAFGHAAYYVYAERGGQICGVLPLIHIKSRLFANGLISGAFGVYGGPVADDADSRAALDRHAEDLLARTGADFLEYRSQTPSRPDWRQKEDLYVTFRTAIEPSMDANLKVIPRKQRAVIRKAIKAEQIRDVVDDDVERLFAVYAESVRNLGTPVFSRRYLRLLAEVFNKDCQILTVEGPDGRPLSSVMSFFFRDQVLPYYGGGTMAARRYGANDFMYWRVMERARDAGYRLFDFGRSKRGTGSFAFKKHWGIEPEPLCYEFKTRDDRPIPDINPLNPKYALFIAAWKRLPMPVANFVGPFLARDLG